MTEPLMHLMVVTLQTPLRCYVTHSAPTLKILNPITHLPPGFQARDGRPVPQPHSVDGEAEALSCPFPQVSEVGLESLHPPPASAQSPEDSPWLWGLAPRLPPAPSPNSRVPGWGLHLHVLSCLLLLLLLLQLLLLRCRATWGWAGQALLPLLSPLLEAGDGPAVLLPLSTHHLAAQVPAGGVDLKDGLWRGHPSLLPNGFSAVPPSTACWVL